MTNQYHSEDEFELLSGDHSAGADETAPLPDEGAATAQADFQGERPEEAASNEIAPDTAPADTAAAAVTSDETASEPQAERFTVVFPESFDREAEMTDLLDLAESGDEESESKQSGDTFEFFLEEPKVKKHKGNYTVWGCVRPLLYATVVIGISIFLSYFIILGLNDMVGLVKTDHEVTVTIPENATNQEIADILEESGVIQQRIFFNLYMSVTNSYSSIVPGKYTINTNYDYMHLVNVLQGEPTVLETVSVTFPEGFTLDQVAERLEENGVCTKDDLYKAVEETELTYSIIKDIPTDNPARRTRLEGYLFPNTYEFFKNEDPASVVTKLVREANTKFDSDMRARAEDMEMSLDEVLILASVIQEESSVYEEMLNISSVFRNRLLSSHLPRLESDPTTEYAIKYGIDEYDTYTYPGLMPGPICNPGYEAIMAALYPADTNYYFFVTDLAGNYYYATNYEAHLRNVAKANAVNAQIGGASTDD